MGVEFDLISDATKEGYELGKGPWSDLKEVVQGSNNPVEAVTMLLLSDVTDSKTASAVASEIIAFMETHPDWRVIDDYVEDVIHVMDDKDRADMIEVFGEAAEDENFVIYRKVG